MIVFLIKSTIVLIVLLAFYKLVLERESYFTANRWYLIATLVFACTLPFISLPKIMENQGLFNQLLVAEGLDESKDASNTNNRISPINTKSGSLASEEINIQQPLETKVIDEPLTAPIKHVEEKATETLSPKAVTWNTTSILIGLYLFGVSIFLIKLLFEVASILYKTARFPDKIKDEQATIINLKGEVAPCSFFHFVFINPSQYDYETYEQILEHEKIHVRKGHSIDLLLAELLVAISWFNPMVWLLRKEIEKNIEYQTDDLLVRGTSADKESYQLNLVKVASLVRPLAITTNYNQSLIKQRILKMNNKRSNPIGYWKYSFVAPLVFAMLVLLNEPGIGKQSQVAEEPPTEVPEKKEAVAEKATPPELPEQNESVPEEASTAEVPEVSEQAEQAEEVQEEAEPEISEPEERVEASDFTELPRNECSVLTQAVREGDIEKVKALLQSTKPNCIDPDPGYEELISNGYTWRRNRARTPLAAAARLGSMEIAQLLIDAGARANFDVSDYGSPMTEAAGGGFNDLLTLFIDKGGDVNEHTQGQGSPLNAASRNGFTETAKFLLERGADVNFQNDGQGSPLNAAARHGYVETAQLLLDNGANINAQNDGQGSALNAAARNGHTEMVKLLLDNGAALDRQTDGQGSALNAAARRGHAETVELLLDRGADIDQQNDGQGSALNAAARNGHVKTIELLLDRGANINLQNDGQGSALNAAARRGHVEAVELLLDRGANVNLQNDGQGSALNAAARSGHVKVAAALIKAGADINRQNDGQGSPLNAAARRGHDDMVKFLLDEGADIDLQNDGQGSALNAAARRGNISTAKILIDRGAKINLQMDGQGSALNAAARRGHLDMVKLLVENGARINQYSEGQGTALSAASRNRHRAVVKYLIDQGANR